MERKNPIQVKHIPDLPILMFLAGAPTGEWGNAYEVSNDRSVLKVLPYDTPHKVINRKLDGMMARDLIDDERGNYGGLVLTDAGWAAVDAAGKRPKPGSSWESYEAEDARHQFLRSIRIRIKDPNIMDDEDFAKLVTPVLNQVFDGVYEKADETVWGKLFEKP